MITSMDVLSYFSSLLSYAKDQGYISEEESAGFESYHRDRLIMIERFDMRKFDDFLRAFHEINALIEDMWENIGDIDPEDEVLSSLASEYEHNLLKFFFGKLWNDIHE